MAGLSGLGDARPAHTTLTRRPPLLFKIIAQPTPLPVSRAEILLPAGIKEGGHGVVTARLINRMRRLINRTRAPQLLDISTTIPTPANLSRPQSIINLNPPNGDRRKG